MLNFTTGLSKFLLLYCSQYSLKKELDFLGEMSTIRAGGHWFGYVYAINEFREGPGDMSDQITCCYARIALKQAFLQN